MVHSWRRRFTQIAPALLLAAAGTTACQFDPPLGLPRGTDVDPSARIDHDAGAPSAVLDAGQTETSTTPAAAMDAGEVDGATDSRDDAGGGRGDRDGGPAEDAEPSTPRDAEPSTPRDAGTDAGLPPEPTLDFDFVPSNFAPRAVAPATSRIEVSGGDCTVTFDPFSASGACTLVGPMPVTRVLQAGVVEASVVSLGALIVAPDARLLIEGTRPVIFAVRGDVLIQGVLSVSASLERSGPGGGLAEVCGDGGDGGPVDLASNGTSGGGGGGFATTGGLGGEGVRSTALGGAAGGQNGNALLIPLRGGCLGGRGGPNLDGAQGAPGGAGGGLQISSARTLRLEGEVWAVGGGGGGGPRGAGAGGGGSGGGILLEAKELRIGPRARIFANGGSGGEGGGGTPAGNDGANGSYGSTTDALPAPGGANLTPSGGDGGGGGAGAVPPGDGLSGSAMSGGGGGGGGAVGRVRINVGARCSIASGALFSPLPTSNDPARCGL